MQFTYTALPGRVVFGAGAARSRLAAEIERLGAQRLLVIAAEPERELAEALTRDLPVAATFSEVRPHVPVEVAQRAREAATTAGQADALLSIGGGSTTGTAKAVALETGLPIVGRADHLCRLGDDAGVGDDRRGRKTTGNRPARAAPVGRLRPRADHRRCRPRSPARAR